MSSKQTPGPWKIIHGGFVSDDGFSVGSDNAAAQRVKVVCECWPCSIVDQQHREELLANARLIAAAPELLDALKQSMAILSRRPSERESQREIVEKAYAVMLAAVQKVDGE